MAVLVIENEADCPLGLLGRRGLDAHVVRPHAGEEVPPSLDGFDGLVVLGGAMNADENDAYPWIPATKALITEAVRTELPTFLVCLGMQMAASTLGGRVEVSEHGPMWGVQPVGLTEEGHADDLFRHLRERARAFHWNGDVVTRLPQGATVLARDPRGGVQAVRYGRRAWGTQCHPEADVAIVTRWAQSQDDGKSAGSVARGRDALEQLTGAEADLHLDWSPVLDAFVAVTKASSPR